MEQDDMKHIIGKQIVIYFESTLTEQYKGRRINGYVTLDNII